MPKTPAENCMKNLPQFIGVFCFGRRHYTEISLLVTVNVLANNYLFRLSSSVSSSRGKVSSITLTASNS